MRHIQTNITLKNPIDVGCYNRGIMQKLDIRQITVKAMVDTGTGTLVINENLRQKLGLRVVEEKEATLINKAVQICKYTEPVEVHWGNRCTAVRAVVLEDALWAPGTDNVLLGIIPMEEMDLTVDPVRQVVTGVHDHWEAIPA